MIDRRKAEEIAQSISPEDKRVLFLVPLGLFLGAFFFFLTVLAVYFTSPLDYFQTDAVDVSAFYMWSPYFVIGLSVIGVFVGHRFFINHLKYNDIHSAEEFVGTYRMANLLRMGVLEFISFGALVIFMMIIVEDPAIIQQNSFLWALTFPVWILLLLLLKSIPSNANLASLIEQYYGDAHPD
ncbi:MAG: hypothetical protein LAT67_01560 [Balneolales bacterium]|nr:hypothetical protein [Balneolales bacterium]